MSNIIQGDFGAKRCRNTEAEQRYNAPSVSLTEPELDFEAIAMSDRILDLMEDPNAVDTNFWYDFWEANSDVWQEMISVNHKEDIISLDIVKLRYRVSVMYNFLEALQLSAEAQAIMEKNEDE
tara:strand:+ start:21 stop:389 length:369 start_codon:yes stop_codon:yes gene_type:complete